MLCDRGVVSATFRSQNPLKNNIDEPCKIDLSSPLHLIYKTIFIE